jgi:hypothetical protein
MAKKKSKGEKSKKKSKKDDKKIEITGTANEFILQQAYGS